MTRAAANATQDEQPQPIRAATSNERWKYAAFSLWRAKRPDFHFTTGSAFDLAMVMGYLPLRVWLVWHPERLEANGAPEADMNSLNLGSKADLVALGYCFRKRAFGGGLIPRDG